MNWRQHAACIGLQDLFFITVNGFPGQTQAKKAKAVCAECPVRQECLDEAIEFHAEWGIWGGLAPRERRAVA
jgi:WhiB family redox-sensing transcriptional regulator